MHGRSRRFSLGGRKGGVWFLVATTAVSVLNFAFHVLFSRSLGPSSYSELGTLLALITIASVPLGALQLATAHASTSSGAGRGARDIVQKTAIAAALGEGLIAISSVWLAHFFHISSPVPVILFGAWLVVATVAAVPAGVLIGREEFRPVAVALFAGTGGVRLVLGALLSIAHAGVDGAMAATIVGQLVTLALLMRTSVESLLGRSLPQMRLAGDDGWLSVSAVTSLAVLVSIDTLMARRLLTPSDSGFYTAADTLGRIALFAPGAVATMAFPRFVAQASRGAASRRDLLRVLGAVMAIGVVAAAALSIAPRITVRTLFGASYGPATHVLVPLAIAGALLGCLTLLSYFHIANRSPAALLGWGGSLLVVFVARAGTISARRLALTDVAMIAVTTAISLGVALWAPTFGSGDREPLVRDVAEAPGIGPIGSTVIGELPD